MLTRLVAFAGYGLQAALALGTILLAASLLPATEFSRFSVLAAAAQFAAIFGFEWIRIAVMRFYPGADDAAAANGKHTIRSLFLRTALVICAIALFALLFGVDLQSVLLLTGLALAQSLSDLHQTMVRFGGRLRRFTRMQMVRSLVLFGATVSGAWMGGTALAALAGMLAAHLVAIVTNRMIDWPRAGPSTAVTDTHDRGAFAAYGMPAALASVLHSGVPVMVRALLIHFLGAGAAAAYLLALDLFQRPLALIAVALNGVLYPEVMREYHDRRLFTSAKQRLYVANVGALALVSGLLIAFAPELAALGVREELQAEFLTAAPWLVGFFLFRSLVQNVFALRWQLALRPWLLAVVGLGDVLLAAGFVIAAALIWAADSQNILVALAASAVLLGGIVGFIQLRRYEPLPVSLLSGLLPLMCLFGATSLLSNQTGLSLLVKIGVSAILSAIWVWAALRSWRQIQ